jgi:type IV pilus assembly protein PilQ
VRMKLELPLLAVLAMLISMVVFGCASRAAKIKKKSVQELYHEAQRDSLNRAPVIQPSFVSNRIEPRVHEPTYVPTSPPSPVTFAAWSQVDAGKSPEPSTLITESFEQTEIHEALSILANAAGVTIIADDSVGGVTSAQMENESIEIALQKVLMPLGLVHAFRDGKYIVTTGRPDDPLFSKVSERHQYLPQNHPATTLATLLPPRYVKYYQVSTERNLISVEAPRSIAREILDRLREFDCPVPQIELEAIVCVSSPDKSFRFGLDWGHVVKVQGADSLKVGMTGLAFEGQSSPPGVRDAFSDFAITSAFVKLLAQEGYVTIRAAPRVTTRDGEKAQISISRETFFSLQPTNSNLLFRQDIQKVESGISLDIIPRVHGDMVSVRIPKAEVSEDIRTQDSRQELTSNPYPIINRRSVTTDVTVRDGHTIVIGGLVQRQTVDRVNRIPGLSRIPLFGRLFQSVEKQDQDAEVAIFISPRIVPPEVPSTGMSDYLNPATSPTITVP